MRVCLTREIESLSLRTCNKVTKQGSYFMWSCGLSKGIIDKQSTVLIWNCSKSGDDNFKLTMSFIGCHLFLKEIKNGLNK